MAGEGAGQGREHALGEVLFEFRHAGASVRVAAIHATTGIEVVAIAPASATPAQMQALALAKLRRRLAQDANPPR